MEGNKGEQHFRSSQFERLAFIDSLRAIAILMVVSVHALGYSMMLRPDLREMIAFIASTVGVPIFFLVDGYLFARSVLHLRNYNYHKYIRASVLRLLAPWAVFTLAYTLVRYGFELLGLLKERAILGHSLYEVVISAYGSVYAPQLYFLFSLFLIRVCSPLFKRILCINSYFALLVLFSSYYVAYRAIISPISAYLTIDGGQEPVLHALWGIQFYLVGIILFKTSESLDLQKLFVPFLLSFLCVLLIENRYGSYGLKYLVQYLYMLTFFLGFTFFQGKVPFLTSIGRDTMGIYLIHAPIVLKGVSLIVDRFVFDPILSYVSVLIGTFGLSICIVFVVNSVPYGRILFGTPYKQKEVS